MCKNQCCGSGSGRIRSFWGQPDPDFKNRIRNTGKNNISLGKVNFKLEKKIFTDKYYTLFSTVTYLYSWLLSSKKALYLVSVSIFDELRYIGI